MALFLVGKGCDMSIANTASITGWELAEKISKRFYIQLRGVCHTVVICYSLLFVIV